MGVKNRNLGISKWGLMTGLVLIGGAATWFGTDKLLEGFFNRNRLQLQQQLSRPLGHPLRIGQYRGLKFWGIAIGPTEVLPGDNDDSTASFQEIKVKFAPLASLFNWRPVVVLIPEKTNLVLRRNSSGSYWVPGDSNGDSSPPIDLRLKLTSPARVFFEPTNLELFVVTRASLMLSQKKVKGFIDVTLPNKGKVFLRGKGYWDRLQFIGNTNFKGLRIQSFKDFLPERFPYQAEGIFNGGFKISFQKGIVGCKGAINLNDFRLKGGALNNSISSNKARIICLGDRANLLKTNWEYGAWKSTLSGDIIFNRKNSFDVSINGFVGLEEFTNPEFNFNAFLPINLKQGSFKLGKLKADFNLSPIQLSKVSSILGTSFGGIFSAVGQLDGHLNDLNTKASLKLINPEVNGVRLQEDWVGTFNSETSGKSLLQMASEGAATPGTLTAEFNKNWSLDYASINRGGGEVFLKALPSRFNWKIDRFRLDGLEIAIPSDEGFKGIFGELIGQGNLSLSPFSFSGEVAMRYPRLIGLQLKEASLSGRYIDNKYSLFSKLKPSDKGLLTLSAEGEIGGEVDIKAEGKELSPGWIASSAMQLPQINKKAKPVSGLTKDLGDFFIETIKGSLDAQLNELKKAQQYLKSKKEIEREKSIINYEDIQGEVDADIHLKGPNIKNIEADVRIKGNLWSDQYMGERPKKNEYFSANLSGPLKSGSGAFSLLNLPFSSLTIFTPLPSSLQGKMNLKGNYTLDKDNYKLDASLKFIDSKLDEDSFVLDKGKFFLSESKLFMDIALRSNSSKEPLTLKGSLPLKKDEEMNIRVESHGDALNFLDGLSGNNVDWIKGNSNLRLLLRGPFSAPEANGFFVLDESRLVVMEEDVMNLEGLFLFDFNRLEVKSLTANIGEEGEFLAAGSVPFVKPLPEKKPLSIMMKKVRLRLPVADVEVAGNLDFNGALVTPKFGGDLVVNDGTISPQRNRFSKPSKLFSKLSTKKDSNKKQISLNESSVDIDEELLPEQKWNYGQPLVLFGQDVEDSSNRNLKESLPKFSFISFDNLKLRLGPKLRITSPPLAEFRTAGSLILNGPLDSTLKASGVIRLLNGRINLFTTTFNLDRSAPNVAVFTPSLGVIPYVDVAMSSRVSENIGDGSNPASSTNFSSNGTVPLGIGGFRLVKVMVQATGPADRLAENIQLSSSPKLPRAQLLGLIGGNSLRRLLGGGETEVLASVLGKSVLTPFLGNISGAFSDRLQLAIYPALVNPQTGEEGIDNQQANSESTSAQVSPQQAWVTEIGFDLTERFNFSVLATPNRKDIPPQGTLNYQVTPNVGLVGSLDKKGAWQSQLQMFFRF